MSTALVCNVEGTTMHLEGRLDAAVAPALRAELLSLLDRCGPSITVDLADATFLDSTALAAVVISVKLARARGGDLTLVTPRSAAVSRVFTLTRLDKVFTMVPAAARSESP